MVKNVSNLDKYRQELKQRMDTYPTPPEVDNQDDRFFTGIKSLDESSASIRRGPVTIVTAQGNRGSSFCYTLAINVMKREDKPKILYATPHSCLSLIYQYLVSGLSGVHWGKINTGCLSDNDRVKVDCSCLILSEYPILFATEYSSPNEEDLHEWNSLFDESALLGNHCGFDLLIVDYDIQLAFCPEYIEKFNLFREFANEYNIAIVIALNDWEKGISDLREDVYTDYEIYNKLINHCDSLLSLNFSNELGRYDLAVLKSIDGMRANIYLSWLPSGILAHPLAPH